MEKPFLTIEEQVELLRFRGIAINNQTNTVLMREGYYSLINGYKDPFLDKEKTEQEGDDRFISETSFDDIYSLFDFDRNLRDVTFPYLIRAEATVRTAISYCFSKHHTGQNDYLSQQNYCTVDEYINYCSDIKNEDEGKAEYFDELSKLIGRLRNRVKYSQASFIAHYREAFNEVPLWVLSNDLTFGTLEHFFNFMRPAEKKEVCKFISESTGRLGDKTLGFFSVDEARIGLEALVKFRNICAHDERLYCASVGDRKQINFIRMALYLERYLTTSEFFSFINKFLDVFESTHISSTENILSSLGFDEFREEINRRLKRLPMNSKKPSASGRM